MDVGSGVMNVGLVGGTVTDVMAGSSSDYKPG